MAKTALFLSGLFFGGAVDHVILAVQQSPLTPYGLRLGITGNWVFAFLDAALAGVLYVAHRRLDYRGVAPGESL